MKKILEEHQIKLLINIPWKYTSNEIASVERERMNLLIQEIATLCPVIDDPYQGVRTEREVFSDSEWHLSKSGATERCRIIGRFLTDNR